jgi:hypothetical protein
MTLEQLLDCEDPEFWEKLTDDQLLEYFKPYLTVTRPELAAKPRQKQQFDPEAQARQLKIMQLKAIGIDVSEAMKGRRK